MTAAIRADVTPTQVTISSAVTSIENKGNNLATRYTPATTMVAACIKADTGVGPSIASGSQMCRGNMADLPAPPINTSVNPQVSMDIPRKEADVILKNCGDCAEVNLSINIPKSKVSL